MVQAMFDRQGKIVGIASALRQKRVVPSPCALIIDGVQMTDEEVEPLVTRDGSSGWTVHVTYVNAKGQQSRRRLTCRKLAGYGEVEQIFAFCHETKRVKSFRVDCMRQVIDMATGEIVDPRSHFSNLRLRGLMRMHDKALDDFSRILVFLAKCDGDYHPLELDAVEHALGRYCLRFGGDDETVSDVVERSAGVAPDGADLIYSLKRISQSPKGSLLARLILEGACSVIEADGELAVDEIEWGTFITDYLKKVAVR
jgi:hypothetical protein